MEWTACLAKIIKGRSINLKIIKGAEREFRFRLVVVKFESNKGFINIGMDNAARKMETVVVLNHENRGHKKSRVNRKIIGKTNFKI